MAKAPRSELKSTGYEIFIGILSMLSIANLVLVYAIDDEALSSILGVMNALFSAIFLGDFIYRIVTAPSAAGYFFRHFGWADLLASLPLPQFKILRIFRVIRVYRLLRVVGIRTIWRTVVDDRAGSALLVLLLMGVLVLQFGSLTILRIEQYAPGANITSASDALWYTIVTISTVGYGDQYPVTDVGRICGAMIIVVGVGIFGTFTGYLANLFLTPRKPAAGAGIAADETDAATPADAPALAPSIVAPSAATGTDAAASVSTASMEELREFMRRSEAELAAIRALLAEGRA